MATDTATPSPAAGPSTTITASTAAAASTEHLAEMAGIGRALATAMSTGDLTAAAALMAPDVVWTFPGANHPLAGTHVGADGATAFAHAVFGPTQGTFRMDVHDVYGGATGAVISFTGTGSRPDGRTLRNPTRLVLTITDGLITHLDEFVWDAPAVAAFWR